MKKQEFLAPGTDEKISLEKTARKAGALVFGVARLYPTSY